MVVVERVPCFLAFLAEFHEARGAQHAKLMRDGGLSHLERFGNVADTHLFLCREQGKDLDPRAVAEDLEEIGKAQARVIVELMKARVLYLAGVRAVDLAEVIGFVWRLSFLPCVLYNHYISLGTKGKREISARLSRRVVARNRRCSP